MLEKSTPRADDSPENWAWPPSDNLKAGPAEELCKWAGRRAAPLRACPEQGGHNG